jgi:hypothetical protein
MENYNNAFSNHRPYSICILYAFGHITRGFVESVFRSLNVGRINNIEMIPKVNQKGSYWQILVHFSFLHNQYEAVEFCKRLDEGKELRIVYDNPWFWKVIKAPLPHRGPGGRIRMVPFIDFSFNPVLHNLEPGKLIARPERCNAISTPDSSCHTPLTQEEYDRIKGPSAWESRKEESKTVKQLKQQHVLT